jgi:hypothetical protein
MKRQRMNSASTGSTLSRNMSPVPGDSNQDANIPDIVASLEMPMLDIYAGFSADGDDDDDSIDDDDDDGHDDDRDDDDSGSDIFRFVASGLRFRGCTPSLDHDFASIASSSASPIQNALLIHDLDELGSDPDLLAERRLPGRRRVPNADQTLEASLRRQLQLRTGHRAVSKALKIVLLELASRVADGLEESELGAETYDSEHEQAMVFELEMYLDQQLELLETELQVLSESYIHQLKIEIHYSHQAHAVSAQRHYDRARKLIA